MELEADRSGFVGMKGRWVLVVRVAQQFRMVLDQHAVVDCGDVAKFDELPVLVELRCGVDYVIGLPRARLAAGIDQRRFRLVERARLAVEVRFVLEGVEHLNVILRTEEDSTISAILTTSFDLFGSGPFDVSLAIVEYGLRTDIARTR